MVIQEIGEAAGKVWHCLNEKGEMTITRLKKELKMADPLLNRALGWLARENKLRFEQTKTGVKVRLA
ncbi:MAG: hypothetical protein FJ279_11075 [Planctomycetes bacterium]|nr:hypothetical protein [Planctomycetota bacterium]